MPVTRQRQRVDATGPAGRGSAAGWQRGAIELAAVVAVALAVLAPGIGGYSLVDPWETHYGEVGRMMRQSHDYVHLQWPGTNPTGIAAEGFRSKPVLAPWLIAAGMHATGLAADGGYSGEMVHGARTMIALRAPFVACGVFGLVMLWWMLARLVGRRAAWLALLVVGSSPMFCMIARQAIPDMPLSATVIGAIALLVLALEDGDRPCAPAARRAVLGLAGGAVAVQALYYAIYFATSPRLAVTGVPFSPAIWLPGAMVLGLVGLWHRSWRALGMRMAPIATMRQVYLVGFYALVGVSVLAKGPPGLAIAGGVALCHVVLRRRWRAIVDGAYELRRGALVIAAICVPWHVAMFLKDGHLFINQYFLFHIVDRAASGVDDSPGTFAMYTGQLGIGMWPWIAVLPAAVAAALVGARSVTGARGRVRALIAIWACVTVALFCLVQTKFHHYILPAVAPLGALIALWLDDVLAGRARLHPLLAAIGAAIALLVCRDLMHEPERWIEMYVFRDDRPWPSGDPWWIDPSDGFLALGAVGALGVALLARWRRLGAGVLGAAGLATCLWALHVYMPIAGTHWGMRDSLRAYYDRRTIYGEKLVYFGRGALYDDWHAAGDRRSFETHVPLALQVGQPMTVAIQVNGARDERITENAIALIGRVTAIGDHSVELTLLPGERDRLAPLLAGGAAAPRGRPAIRVVDADRIAAWQLYWRGENFWTAEEIWGLLPELKATFLKPGSAEFVAYLKDPARAPPGRRMFVIVDTARIASVQGLAPTPRAAASFEVVDRTSNKFALVAFDL